MSNFKVFADAVSKQWELMSTHQLFKTNTPKDEVWDTYLSSFPEGTNPLFRKKSEHDCNCCKSFIHRVGNVVTIIDNKLVSIWDVTLSNDDAGYVTVSKALSNLIHDSEITEFFLTTETSAGYEPNRDTHDDSIKWTHFNVDIPLVCITNNLGLELLRLNTLHQVFSRGMNEIPISATKTALELIAQGSVYRGDEHKQALESFLLLQKKFHTTEDPFIWLWSRCRQQGARTRNTAVGTFLIDIAKDMDIQAAVDKFGHIMSPNNYQRPKAAITPKMVELAENTVIELGYGSSLLRRHAYSDDITVNNVIYADRGTKPKMKNSIFDDMKEEAIKPISIKSFDKVESIPIDKFISDVVPHSTKIEVLMEGKHSANMVSLIAPSDPDSKNIFLWLNNFSWMYKGGIADSSMKTNVKKAGGSVTGDLRFSIQWNDKSNDQNDLDAQCILPGHHIYFNDKYCLGERCLDVDVIDPGTSIAVENITFSDRKKFPPGDYRFFVNNYDYCGGDTGFRAEIEFDGNLYQYDYPKSLCHRETIHVATVTLKDGQFSINHHLENSSSGSETWGITSGQFQTVTMLMNSPNHWDDSAIGNKHTFFILDGCNNPDPTRGFVNEFLSKELVEHRKVFETLGSKLQLPESTDQLSGLGFSSTKRNTIIVRVSGNVSRILKVKF